MNQKRNFSQLQILFYALLAGQVLMGAALWFLMKNRTAQEGHDADLYRLIVPVVVIGGVVVSLLIRRMMKRQAASLTTLQEKVEHFWKMWILRAAIQEGGNLMAAVLAFIAGSTYLLLWFVIGVAAFLLLRPSLFAFGNDYDVEGPDLEKLIT